MERMLFWILKKFKSSFRNHFSQIKALTFNFDRGCVWFANLIEMVNLSITNYFTVILFISEGVLLCVESHIENNRSIYSKGIDSFGFLKKYHWVHWLLWPLKCCCLHNLPVFALKAPLTTSSGGTYAHIEWLFVSKCENKCQRLVPLPWRTNTLTILVVGSSELVMLNRMTVTKDKAQKDADQNKHEE